ncbi:hypothetical protein X975_06838, partial [Stegodyphus mimosarum]
MCRQIYISGPCFQQEHKDRGIRRHIQLHYIDHKNQQIGRSMVSAVLDIAFVLMLPI